MKTHLLRNVGKGPYQFHQGQARFLVGGFLLSHGLMTTGTSALFLLGRHVRTERLLTKGDPHHPVDLSSSLFRGFFVDELHGPRFIQLWWRVTGARSAGFGLDLVQPRDPFFTGRYFIRTMPGLRWNPTIVLDWPPFPLYQHVASFPFQDFLPEITSRPILALFAHRVSKTCLL